MREEGSGIRDRGSGIGDWGRRGSALLIVLGMLAFIVASAVAFSAYMRYARMPSSYLRRTSSSRLLVKAALAEAIDVIDTSIGNDAYPGQKGRNYVKTYRRITDDENNDADVIDYWQDRCFIGSNTLVSVDSTVATLCTEALAYIPPAIINEVRYYSRRSLAAQWHTLGYDSGRFAFTAVDVSDFFDVNSVCATPLDLGGQHMYGRNSSDTGRITLAHVFENPQHTGYTYQPDDWDEFMDTYLDSGKLPLVSVADLNLAMNKQGLPAYMSPFCNYIRNGANFVTSDSVADPEVNLVRNMAFVTDGLFAITNRKAQAIDISRRNDQPFVGHEKGATLQQALNDIDNRFLKRLGDAGSPLFKSPEVVQLYDYLDEDSVPLSLAMPTVERTPMITGVGLDGQLTIMAVTSNPDVQRTANPGTPGVDFEFEKKTSSLTLNGNLLVSAGLVFPFKYKRPSEHSFKVQAALTVTFVPGDYEKLRRNTARTVVAWANSKKDPTPMPLSGAQPAYVMALSDMKTVSLPSKEVLEKEEDAVLTDQTFPFNFSAVKLTLPLTPVSGSPFTGNDDCSLRVVRKYNLIANPNGGAPLRGPEVTANGFPAQECGWLPVNAALDNVEQPASFLTGTTKYHPVIQVWVRIVDGNANDKTVDLSPAYWEDDDLTGGSKCKMLHDLARGSAERPLLRFHATNPTTCTVSFNAASDGLVVGAANQAQTDFRPKAYLANDPRFNYAPEDMIAVDNLTQKFNPYWLTAVHSDGDVLNRDGDIFMATSDAGYLQSAYEFGHIGMTSASGGNFGVMNNGGYDGEVNGKFTECPAYEAMWKTYSEYDSSSSFGDIDRLDIINGSRGFRVNPYTPSTDIMLAALANSPLDWWSASTNKTVNTKVHDSAANAAKYSFSEMGASPVKMRHANLEAIAKRMIGAFRGSNGDWRQEFDELGWDDDADTLCGVKLDNNVQLHSVDRKFLHGFWKECLANRQQLFLVFVRAEPMMMGGGGLGQTPPQLGARAVALVWRDPTKTADDVAGLSTSGGPRPHRTRILFYRQFD